MSRRATQKYSLSIQIPFCTNIYQKEKPVKTLIMKLVNILNYEPYQKDYILRNTEPYKNPKKL